MGIEDVEVKIHLFSIWNTESIIEVIVECSETFIEKRNVRNRAIAITTITQF
jgi:hypothetical protein